MNPPLPDPADQPLLQAAPAQNSPDVQIAPDAPEALEAPAALDAGAPRAEELPTDLPDPAVPTADSGTAAPDAPDAPDAPNTPDSADTAAGTPAPRTPDLAPAACAAALAQHFPALFGAGVLLPVKLRIHADIQQRAPGVFTRKSLSLFLHRHTTSTPYIRALLAAANRFDLDGQPAGDIAPEHRAAAVTELDRRKAIVLEKRAAQRAAPDGTRTDRVPGQRFEARRAPQSAQQAVQQTAQEGAQQGAQEGTQQGAQQGAPEGAPQGARHPARFDRPARSPRPGPPQRSATDAPRPRREANRADSPAAAPQHAPRQPPAAVADLPPQDAAAESARRERSSLLRAFEGSTLTKANFLVLKRMKEAELDAQLLQARQERQEWQARHPAAPRDELHERNERSERAPGPARTGRHPGGGGQGRR